MNTTAVIHRFLEEISPADFDALLYGKVVRGSDVRGCPILRAGCLWSIVQRNRALRWNYMVTPRPDYFIFLNEHRYIQPAIWCGVPMVIEKDWL